jgi:hypothetical protein
VGILSFFAGCKKNDPELVSDVGGTRVYVARKVQDGVFYGSIYFSSAFNAFTDLAYYKNMWIAVFREGTAHASGDPGRIKVLTSTDGARWKVSNILSLDSVDLRDPKIMVDSAGQQMYITFFGRDETTHHTRYYRNFYVDCSDSITKSKIEEITESWPASHEYITWRWTSYKQNAYCAAYRLSAMTDTTTNLCMTVGSPGLSNRKVYKRINLPGQPTETTMRFDKQGKMYLIVRADGEGSKIGATIAPYNNINWLSNGGLPNLASPNFLIRDSLLLITGRDKADQKFKFFSYNYKTETIEHEVDFPGGYEVGYGGMVYNPKNKNELWISYYSIENGGSGSNIYLAKLDLEIVLK